MNDVHESHAPDPRREPGGRRPARVVIVIAGLAAAAVLAFALLGRDPTPAVDPFAFDPDVAGTDVRVPPPAPDPAPPDPAPPAEAPAGDRTDVTAHAAPTGRLDITSVPSGALVTVDGRHAGTTPVTVGELAWGTHVVQVARPGYVPVEERVDLSGEVAVRQLSIRLDRGAAATASGPRAARGRLDVDTRPRGATVTVGGRRLGQTPLALPDLPAGTHDVELTLAGYRTVRTTVVVRAGERTRLALSLEAGARGRTH